MTKKDYIKLANVMLNNKPTMDNTTDINAEYGRWLNIVSSLSTTLALDNPRFKHDVFMKACGVDK